MRPRGVPHATGYVTFQEFLKAVRRSVMLSSKMATDQQLRHVFEFVDRARSGRVSPRQIIAFLNGEGSVDLASHEVSTTVAKEIYAQLAGTDFAGVAKFHLLDIDGSGHLHENEVSTGQHRGTSRQHERARSTISDHVLGACRCNWHSPTSASHCTAMSFSCCWQPLCPARWARSALLQGCTSITSCAL